MIAYYVSEAVTVWYSRQVAGVGEAYSIIMQHTVNIASAVAQQLQLQQWHSNCNAKLSKSNNQLVMIALTEAKTWHWEDNGAASKRASKKSTDSCIGKTVWPQQQSKSKDEVVKRMTCNKNSEWLLQQDVFKSHGAASS